MKTIFSLIIAIVLFTLNYQIEAAKEKDNINIAVVFDGPNYLNKIVLNLVKQEIFELTHSEFDINFPKAQIFECEWDIDEIKNTIKSLFLDEDVDFIITLGAVGSDFISKQDTLVKPVIAPFIVDAELQGLYSDFEKGHLKNLNYLEVPFTTSNTLKDFQSVVNFENLAVLYSDIYLTAIPALEQKTRKTCGDGRPPGRPGSILRLRRDW